MGREHLQFITTLLVGSGKYNCCNALPHYQRAVGRGTPAIHHHTAWGHYAVELLQCTLKLPFVQRAVEHLQCTATPRGGSGKWNSCNTPPQCPGAGGSGPPTMHRHTAWGGGPWNFCISPHYMGVVGGVTAPKHFPSASGLRAVEIVPCSATPPGGGWKSNGCNAPPHCLGAVGSGNPITHCHTTCRQWAVELLQRRGRAWYLDAISLALLSW